MKHTLFCVFILIRATSAFAGECADLPEVINDANQQFYALLHVETLAKYADASGITNGEDIAQIYSKLKEVKSIVEVGAGYGRVITNLRRRGFSGRITAVELNPSYAKYLTATVGDKADVVNISIFDYRPKETKEVAILPWSVFAEFSPSEQQRLIKHLKGILAPRGQIFIDLPVIGKENNATSSAGKIHKVETEQGTHTTFIPDLEDITGYAKEAGFGRVEETQYKAGNDRSRVWFVLSP